MCRKHIVKRFEKHWSEKNRLYLSFLARVVHSTKCSRILQFLLTHSINVATWKNMNTFRKAELSSEIQIHRLRKMFTGFAQDMYVPWWKEGKRECQTKEFLWSAAGIPSRAWENCWNSLPIPSQEPLKDLWPWERQGRRRPDQEIPRRLSMVWENFFKTVTFVCFNTVS